ncbi:putative ABC transporter ATP-binding protein YxlF [Bradyrhizobium ivorense]|uniref:ABC transporter ATP-binding protein YxlF n=1 Tax=Bradyrhizobium ivorense TaxID=2511166 RepID=A0A508T946_9BRAD|nr:ABC transporter ATP-binding protein [Bradyrhizobium ivorense]VIO71483.1 putative ABC transporter ATP-binding protein YxlF [Bradyrhizobium ivorense]
MTISAMYAAPSDALIQRDHAPAISASNVSKRYGPVSALEGLTLDVHAGEVFGLLGPNGSGKTTFMRLLAGYLLPSAGRLMVAGHDVVGDSIAVRRHIGYVPEAAPLYRQMRVGEFLAFMARLRGVPERDVKGAVERIVDRLALSAVADKPTRALSKGYRQRTALAQALVHDPDILILDEPTNGLDPRQIIEMRQLIRSLAGRHTVLISSHILSEVEKTCDRVAVLLNGRLLGVRAMADTPDLEAWFLSLT